MADGDDGGVDGVTDCCPECDSGLIRKTSPDPINAREGHESKEWRCQSCGHRFDTPEVRDRKRSPVPRGGLARELYEMDPDDLPASE